MENQEVLKSIAVLADKVGRYHERLMAVERDNVKLEKELAEHKNGCQCNSPEPKKAYEEECESCSA